MANKRVLPDITADDLRHLFIKHGSWVLVAKELNANVSTVRNMASKAGINAQTLASGSSGKTIAADNYIVSDNEAEWGDIRALLASRGLSEADWIVTRARVNEWGGEDGKENAQLRVDLAPRMSLLVPAKTDGWKPPPRAKASQGTNTGLVVCLGDHHAPRHSPALHQAVCEWLREFKPERGVILGDLLDFDQLSRHRRTPEWSNTVQETIDAGYSILRAYVEASPGTRWQMLDGNHEERMRNSILDHLVSVFGVSQAITSDHPEPRPVLSTPFLLRLDELGIEWEQPNGGYENAQIKLTSELAARHGWIASKGSGSSALKTIDHLRYSVIIGHTHRQAIVHHTAHSIDGKPKTLLGCEAGTLAEVEGGLGYANAPDWQMGFATAQVYAEDGTFKVDLATFVDGLLMWRDWRCRP
jgi:hypothetical protein